MKYLEKYNRYIDNDCVIYRKDKEGKLVQVKPSINNCGYEFICYGARSIIYVHKLVYETFKGEIPEGMEIDHIDRNKRNNNPDNLRAVTHKENMGNRSTKSTHHSTGDFSKKYFAHFGYYGIENPKQYHREQMWYITHNKKCRWE
jgi:hypothetical protein